MRDVRIHLILMLTALAVSASAKEPPAPPTVPAPDFRITTWDKKVISLAQLKGKVIVVNVWATWCAPCRAEMLDLEKYAKLHEADGLQVVGLTEPTSSFRDVAKLAPSLGYPISVDSRAPGYFLTQRQVPRNIIINRSGTVRYARPGVLSLARLDALAAPLLSEAPPP